MTENRISRYYYSDSIAEFRLRSLEGIVGRLSMNNQFALELTQGDAWKSQVLALQDLLQGIEGHLYLEYSIPRMGKRIDAVIIVGGTLFVVEFKVGETSFPRHAVDQVWDYALDLKYFHEPSRDAYVVPILVCTGAMVPSRIPVATFDSDRLSTPLCCNLESLRTTLHATFTSVDATPLNPLEWETGRYCPTPTIIEAATALYKGHSVADISRSDAGALNLSETSQAITEIVNYSRANSRKSICFVTGVPGAGKTLVGLNIATQHMDPENELYSVFLSGNAPLVAVLREALTRDKVATDRAKGILTRKGKAASEIKAIIQNVHHFFDDCLNTAAAPIEHVALFDEAQRAWNKEQTARFMASKKGVTDFDQSEPAFLISCLDRHKDWAVIVCLVGGGQEINTGEAGIRSWIDALETQFEHWDIYLSPHLGDSEYDVSDRLKASTLVPRITYKEQLHLSLALRSFRAEHLSLLVKQLLDLKSDEAKSTLLHVKRHYPFVVTRDLLRAKQWIKQRARGSERYGMVVSSQAERLKPHAIDVRTPVDPIHWFLSEKDDVRSSYYLEDVATEFQVQGLELDWVCMVWDADFRFDDSGWKHHSFCGNGWRHIRKDERKAYLKNAYRVLMTRARQGMVVVIPPGDLEDPTRLPDFYDPTFEYLREIGFEVI